jgi:hypothetical protein
MKTQAQINAAKGRITKAENEKKILSVCGYEIWRDPLNYTTVKNGKNLYFSTFKLALTNIRNEIVKDKLADSENLNTVIERIEAVDKRFIDALSRAVAALGAL